MPMVPMAGPLVNASTSASNDSLDFYSIRDRCSAFPTLYPISLVLLLTSIPKLFPPTFLVRLLYTVVFDYSAIIVTYPNWPCGTSTSSDGSSSMVASAPVVKLHRLPKGWSLSQPEIASLSWA
jgi:hypothetical protein